MGEGGVTGEARCQATGLEVGGGVVSPQMQGLQLQKLEKDQNRLSPRPF